MSDANCSPSTWVTSARDAFTRRRNSDTMRSCVGSFISAVPFGSVYKSGSLSVYPLYTSHRRKGRKLLQLAFSSTWAAPAHKRLRFPQSRTDPLSWIRLRSLRGDIESRHSSHLLLHSLLPSICNKRYTHLGYVHDLSFTEGKHSSCKGVSGYPGFKA
jgi:hypothetical protein